ncbi:MAG: PEGA domain-containing protein [Myxococcota bacterium]
MLRLQLMLLATLLVAPTAMAQGEPGAEEKASAARLLDEGNKLFADHDYAGAIAKYDEAYKTYPSWKILLNLAEAHRSAGHADRAADLFEKVRDTLPPSAASQLPRIEERLNELKAQLGQLLVTADVEGAHIFIDGYDIGQTPMPARRVVAGHHAIRVEIAGHAPVLAEVDVAARSLETFHAALKAETPPVAVLPSPTPSASPSPSPAIVAPPIETKAAVTPDEGGSSAVWWILGAVAVAAAAGVTVAVVASSSGDTFVPGGELGRFTTSDGWTPINRGGL